MTEELNRYSVIVRVDYVFEVQATDEKSAEKKAEDLFDNGKLEEAVSSHVDSTWADEMGPE